MAATAIREFPEQNDGADVADDGASGGDTATARTASWVTMPPSGNA